MAARPTDTTQRTTQPGALRAVLRPILRAVIARPGALYQPLYIGPLSSLEHLDAEVQGLAEIQGLPVYFGYGDQVRRAINTGMPAVIVMGLEAARMLLADQATLPDRQQIVIWGDVAPADLPPDVAARLAGGIGFDPWPYIRQNAGEWTMGPTLARTARDPGNIYNPVLLVAPKSALAFVADEAALRLEAAGLRPVLTLSGTVREDEPALGRIDRTGGVVLRVDALLDATSLKGLSALVERRVQTVLVLTPEAQEALQSSVPALLDRAISLIVARDVGPDHDARKDDGAIAKRSWPPIGDLLVSPPVIGREPDRTMSGRLEMFPLPDILQTLASGRHTGRLAVFTRNRLGAIDFRRGRVQSAWILGDLWEMRSFLARRGAEGARALIEERVCAMGQWQDASCTFFVPEADAGLDGLNADLHVDALALEIARRADENPRRALRIGGLSRIWASVGTAAPGDLAEEAASVLAAIDGERPLADVAIELGLLADEILDAVLELQSRKLIVARGDASESGAIVVHQVVVRLLEWGLAPEALRVLSEAEQANDLTPEGYVLQAHLLAGTDPQGAAVAFRHGAQKLEGGAFFDAVLNALFLEVRGRQRPAADAWKEVRRLLRAGHAANARTLRHYAVVAELALRAGDAATAKTTLTTLRGAGADGERLYAALSNG